MKKVLLLAGLLLCSLPCSLPVSAQTGTYPDRALKIIVPFTPGGSVDIVARIVGDKLGAALGQPVVIDNRGGAGGAIGAEAAARSAPDGYTLFDGTGSTHGTNSAVNSKLPYDPIKDFAPVIMLVRTPFALVAHPSVPAQTAGEFVALAKSRPGKINFASFGPGSSNHLPMELLKAMTGIDIVHIPYKGAAPAASAVFANDVQVLFDVLGSAGQHIRSGKMKLLGIASMTRTPVAPDAPTLHESGIPGFEASAWQGIFAPAGTPPAIVNRLNRDLNAVLALPEVRERLAGMAFEVVGGKPQDLAETAQKEIAKWQKLTRERNLTFGGS